MPNLANPRNTAYTREEIERAIVAAGDAGDMEAVRELGQMLPQEQPQQAPRAQEPQGLGDQLAASFRNTAGGLLAGAVSATADFPRDITTPVRKGLNNAMTYGPAAALDFVGADGAADWMRQRGDIANRAIDAEVSGAGMVNALLPKEPGMGAARTTAEFIGSALVPVGPKAAPRPQSVPRSVTSPRAASAEAQVVRTGEQEGVRTFTTDIAPPKTGIGRVAQSIGERIPYAGMGGPRAAQQQERVDLVRRVADEFGAASGDALLDEVAENLAQTRGKIVRGLTARKDRIIDSVQGGVESPQAVRAIDEQLTRLAENFDPADAAPVVERLQRLRGLLTEGRSLRAIEENRRLLGDAFKGSDNASIRTFGEKAVRSIYDPLRSDMTNAIRKELGEEAASRFTNTNNRLAGMVKDLESSTYKRVLSDADTTPERVRTLLFSQKPSDVRRLNEGLSATGKRRAQSAIIAEAIERAGGLEGIAQLSPQKFANTLGKFGENIGIVFSPADAQRLQGIQRLLQSTQRASVASVTPPTGAVNQMPLIAAIVTDALGTAGGAITTGALAGWSARLYESPLVRDRLIRLAKTKPGSGEEATIASGIAKIIATNPTLRDALTAVNGNAVNVTSGVANDQQN